MPPPRPPSYPLDVTPRFTSAGQKAVGIIIKPIGEAASGLTHKPDGDLWTFEAVTAVQLARQELYRVAAYADLTDVATQELKQQLALAVERLETKIDAVQDLCTSLTAAVGQVAALLGVVIPAWTTRSEVENGDEMGVVSPSAAELGLAIVFETVRNTAGFGHEDVVAITPTPGTLVPRGSEVRILINLMG